MFASIINQINCNKRGWLFSGLLFTMFQSGIAQHQHEGAAQVQPKEEDYYKITTVPIPNNIELEVGGMAFLPNDVLVVSTRRGEVWTISNPYMKNDLAPNYKLFAQGLHEALGVNYIKGELYVIQRPELTRLRDTDGDGRADEFKTVYSWPQAGNYHEYTYGPIEDKEGNLVINRNLGYTQGAVALSKWDGWMLKITPDGKLKPYATGMRSPSALGMNSEGDIFYSENQGEWVGSGSITHVEEGDFLGHPEGLRWAAEPGSSVKLRFNDIPSTGEPKYDVAKRIPGLKTPSVWLPHTILGISTAAILNYDQNGKMGPFEGQLFVGDQGHSKITRVALEKVKGVYQGVAYPFREGFSSGILRTVWGSDGSMFVGMTSRGWGATGKDNFGLQRLEWTGKIPFEVKTVKAKPDGFELEFTQPVQEATAKNVESYSIISFTYKYQSGYGSPTINQQNCPIKAIELSADRTKVRLVVDSLREGYIHEINAAGLLNEAHHPLLHHTGYYTLNHIPDGQRLTITEANRVKVPVAAKPPVAAEPVKSTKLAKHVTTQPASWTKGADKSFVITPVPGLKFSVSTLNVKAGDKIKLTFKNTDDMLHNIVFTQPGAADNVGAAALKLGIDGEQMNYVPNSSQVIAHSFLLQPGKSETIYFVAPEKPGQYQYVCTFPGHHLLMRGVLNVTAR